MDVVRIIGVLDPGGAQLSVLRLTRALEAHGLGSTRLLAGDATAEGLALAEHYGVAVEAFRRVSAISQEASLQWEPSESFADWLAPRLAGADLVHGHMFGAWWAAAVAAPSEVHVVASEHNQLTWPGEDHTSAATNVAGRLAVLFAHGPAAAEFAERIGVPAARIRAGRSAIGRLDARPMPELAGPRITFTGRFREDKGPDILVEAVARLADPPPTYLVGDGPMRAQLLSLARRSGIADLIRLPGWVRSPERWVAGSSVHVVPSREEAWSQSAVIGLALGVPVVGTRVDGLQHTLGGGRGLIVPPEQPDILAAVLADVLAGHRPDPEPGHRYAAEFTPEAVAAHYAEVYQAVLDQVSGGILSR
ncbi:MAG: glycosyltransferase [Actinomycetota bacterium]|nr:glycosyltransferase [Actinomycetota bacterium]